MMQWLKRCYEQKRIGPKNKGPTDCRSATIRRSARVQIAEPFLILPPKQRDTRLIRTKPNGHLLSSPRPKYVTSGRLEIALHKAPLKSPRKRLVDIFFAMSHFCRCKPHQPRGGMCSWADIGAVSPIEIVYVHRAQTAEMPNSTQRTQRMITAAACFPR